MEKDMKSYPNNLLRQIFPGEQFDDLADDSGIALDYVISETMSESDALLLKMRYKENMTYADIAKAVGNSSSTVTHSIRKAERKLSQPIRKKKIRLGMHNLFKYVIECEENRLEAIYRRKISSLERANAILRQEKYIPESPEPDIIDEGIEVLDLSVRCYNVLRRGNIKTVRDLVETEPEKIYNLPNLGRKSLEELLDVLYEKGFAYKSMEIWRSYEGGL
ncbi:DNA-directed RNA polymerase subunit alpha C-terminal domain-containing protein [Huintestinicola sp.]